MKWTDFSNALLRAEGNIEVQKDPFGLNKQIAGSLAMLVTLLTIACGEKSMGPAASRDKGIDTLVADIGVPPDPDPPKPGLWEVESTTPVEWPYGETWICRSVRVGLTTHPLEFPILDPLAGTVWPGAALQGRSILDGRAPDPITAPRGPGEIVLTNASGNPLSSVHVNIMGLSEVTAAINNLVAARAPNEFPADFYFGARTVRSTQELQVQAEASGGFMDAFSASTRFSYEESEQRTWFLVVLRQKYYTVVYERPQLASEFFADGVTVEDLKPYIGPGNPPVYVHSVSYGRVFYFLVSTTDSRNALEIAVNASFFGVVDAGGGFKDVTTLRDKRLEGFAYGGSAQGALEALNAGWQRSSSVFRELTREVDIRFAKPVSYVVRSVYNDKLVRNALATEYRIDDCAPANVTCVPGILQPGPGEALDNGCAHVPDNINWTFSWTPCVAATEYELLVNQAQRGTIINTSLTGTSYTHTFNSPFTDLFSWTWMVRAKQDGVWGDWSPVVSFRLESLNTDCETGVDLYEAINYGGRKLRLTANTPSVSPFGFNDVTSSVRLHNITAVTLYEADGYGGRSITLTADTPSIHVNPYGFGDAVSSVKIVP